MKIFNLGTDGGAKAITNQIIECNKDVPEFSGRKNNSSGIPLGHSDMLLPFIRCSFWEPATKFSSFCKIPMKQYQRQ